MLSGRVAVWGLGQEGLAVARMAMERGLEPLLLDDRPTEAAARAAIAFGWDRPVLRPAGMDWHGVDVLVRSPGISRYRTELADAEAAGARVTTAMAVWLEDFGDARVIAVTGTKGKSTTATLAAAILAEDGWQVELIGNIGVPVVETYRRARADVYVVEVSSYQAVDVTRSPGVIVLTGLAPDHLDWHGGIETYYRDKLRLVEAGPAGALAVSAASPEAVRRTEAHPFRTLFGPEGRVRVSGSGLIEVDGAVLVDSGRLRIPGRHNVWNLCGAVTGVLLATGAPPSADAVGVGVDGFDGLPSRCRTIGDRSGLTYVDDALGFQPVRVGRLGRGVRRAQPHSDRRRRRPGRGPRAPAGRAGRPPAAGGGGRRAPAPRAHGRPGLGAPRSRRGRPRRGRPGRCGPPRRHGTPQPVAWSSSRREHPLRREGEGTVPAAGRSPMPPASSSPPRPLPEVPLGPADEPSDRARGSTHGLVPSWS